MEEKLSNAVVSGDIVVIQKYLEEGGDFNEIQLITPNNYGNLPIELAVSAFVHYNGTAEIIQLIKSNTSEESHAETLLRFASEDTYLKEMKALLESGVDVDLVYQGSTALQRATGNQNLKMVHLLLTYGADPNKEGEYGTALEAATENAPVYKEIMQSFSNGIPVYLFDFVNKEKIINKMKLWYSFMERLAQENKEETFYVVAIDGGKLLANSKRKFHETLRKYTKRSPQTYSDEENISKLKYSSGDFFYYQNENEKETTSNAIDLSFLDRLEKDNRTEKDLLLEGLIKNKELFTKNIKISDDFKIIASGHVY